MKQIAWFLSILAIVGLSISLSYKVMYAGEEEALFIVQLQKEVQPNRWLAYAPENEPGQARLQFHVILPRDGTYSPGQYIEVTGAYNKNENPRVITTRQVRRDIPQSYASGVDGPASMIDGSHPQPAPDPSVIRVDVTIGERLPGSAFRWVVHDRATNEEYVAHFINADGEVLPTKGAVYTLFGRLAATENGRKVLAVFRDTNHETGHKH